MINFLRYILVVFIYGANTVSADVDLLYCIELALQDNSEIKKARAEFSAFKELEDQSLANLLPSVGLSISRSKVNQDRSDGVGATLNQEYLMESDAISLRQPVYRPKLFKDLQRTKKEVLSEQLLLSKKEDVLKMKVIEAYFRSLRAYAEELLLEKRITLLNEQNRAATKSIDAGRGTVTELAEINAARDKAFADLIRARQNIRLELNELQFYTGLKIKKIKKLNENINNFDIFKKNTITMWEDDAVQNNYELRSKKEKISAAKIALSSEKLNRYPTIDLNIQMARGSSESTFFVDSETNSNSIGLTFFLPLYQGGSVNSKIRQSVSNLDAEVEGLKLQEEDLRKRVQKIYFGMLESIELHDALKSAIKSATIELEATKKSTAAGVRKQLDVLVSQQKALSVEREFVEAKLNIIVYWLNLNMLKSNLNRETIKKVNTFLIPS